MYRLRQVITISWGLVLVIFLLPLCLAEPGSSSIQERTPTLPIDRVIQSVSPRDRGRAVRLQQPDGTVVQTDMESYLRQVVAAEMPASFARKEPLRLTV